MTDRIFTIDSQSKYRIEFTEIEDLENCPDEFVTEDELTGMGVDYFHSGNMLLKSKIKQELTIYLSRIQEGKKSIKIDDEELIEALKDYPVSSFVPNTRRVGNRLSRHIKAERTTANHNDWKSLLHRHKELIKERYDVHVNIDQSCSDRVGAVDFLKKNFTWDEVKREQDDVDVSFWKMIWDNPEISKKKG
jgi:hypothetical protein